MARYITNAREHYDGFSTKTIKYLGHMPNPLWREIEIDDADYTWQSSRYQSGTYAIFTPEQFKRLETMLRDSDRAHRPYPG